MQQYDEKKSDNSKLRIFSLKGKTIIKYLISVRKKRPINIDPTQSIHPFNFPFRLLTDYGKYGAIQISVGMDVFMIGNKLR